ncbi:MAG: double-strand break repair protein AddB [Paracoccaceae bacterium]
MFERDAKPHFFALPPGANFPRALVAGLVDRLGDSPPDQLARVTIYLNSARMLRHVRETFSDHGARLLPRLRLIADIGADPLRGVRPAVSGLRRRLELAQLVSRLLEREADFAPGAAAFDLADSLARLMDEMQGEGVPPGALERAGLAENHAAHWERSLAFIRIVARYFGPDAQPDAEARQRLAVEALAERWKSAPPQEPVIVAGSTGSRGATQVLMQAVAGLPAGAVVLPGFDFDMPEFAWKSLCSGPFAAEDHPQYRFLRLCEIVGCNSADIRRWQDGTAPNPMRNRVISLSLRPAPVTDQWMSEGRALGDLAAATSELTLIEAQTQRQEALSIALCLRRAAGDGRRAALITPDRTLTRRVAAALDRWRIIPDDSAGQPLSQTAPGRLLRHTAQLIGKPVATETLLVLLKHPLTATGAGARGDHLRFTRDLELKLRRHGPPFPTSEDLSTWAAGYGEDARKAWAEWLGSLIDGARDRREQPLSTWVERHLAMTEAFAAGPGGGPQGSELWREEAGRVALAAMRELSFEAPHGGNYDPGRYANLITSLLGKATVRQIQAAHPLIAIWGTLEARVQGADLVILAGLNDGVWPEKPSPDPWLSRQMRQKVGLLSPERQVGLSAHDFQQAAGAPEVVLSRAIRDDEAQTVASRWLARLTNLLDGLQEQGGKRALEGMRARGSVWTELAKAMDQPDPDHKIDPAPRPAPRPPVGARSTRLAVTGIRDLIRDPYAVYARHILGLRPLDPLRATADARIRGNVLHLVLERFVGTRPKDESAQAALSRLMAVAESVLLSEVPWPSAQRLWLARLARASEKFIEAESSRAVRGEPVILEERGSVSLQNATFTLTARPDRIDLLEDGRIHIYDYKTGQIPTEAQVRAFDKQLLLEAAMALRGGFRLLGPREVEGVTYIGLGGDAKERTIAIDHDTLDQTWDGLEKLIASYLLRETGYASRRAVFDERREGDYDQLARFGEWQMSDAPKPEDVG